MDLLDIESNRWQVPSPVSGSTPWISGRSIPKVLERIRENRITWMYGFRQSGISSFLHVLALAMRSKEQHVDHPYQIILLSKDQRSNDRAKNTILSLNPWEQTDNDLATMTTQKFTKDYISNAFPKKLPLPCLLLVDDAGWCRDIRELVRWARRTFSIGEGQGLRLVLGHTGKNKDLWLDEQFNEVSWGVWHRETAIPWMPNKAVNSTVELSCKGHQLGFPFPNPQSYLEDCN